MPLYPDWINAENTIILLVTFQIQNKLLCLICRFLLQNVYEKYDPPLQHDKKNMIFAQRRVKKIVPKGTQLNAKVIARAPIS